ncbi:retrovirus-related Pol polyprotein from transposon 297 [Trichonephila clavipes]|nr:retrovirus-related Pol polyprotein from transposon 297 [Trichonephila clavipes]
MSQWYAKFIKNYADICEPLYNLKRKLKFTWSIEAQKAFDVVKAAITKAPVLKFPDFKNPFELFMDASSIGVGAVLNQEQRPILFVSRTLSAAERNYTKLVMVSDGTEFAVGDIERLFEEARRNTKTKHEKWEKYYNRRMRDVQIKVRIYRHRKCDETEIGTGSSDNGSLRDESSGFDRMQRRSNESRDGKKKGTGEPDRKVQKSSEHIVNKRNLSSNDTNSVLTKHRKKSRTEKTATPTTSGYNLRSRNGKGVESRPTIERKTQQGGPVRSKKGRGTNNSPYIEERTRSSNKNARRGGDQQRQDQERRGACTKKSLSLEVLLKALPQLTALKNTVLIEILLFDFQ